MPKHITQDIRKAAQRYRKFGYEPMMGLELKFQLKSHNEGVWRSSTFTTPAIDDLTEQIGQLLESADIDARLLEDYADATALLKDEGSSAALIPATTALLAAMEEAELPE